jgi:hypothetical protein
MLGEPEFSFPREVVVMSFPEPESRIETDSNASSDNHTYIDGQSSASARLWAFALIAGILSGVVAWLAGEACLNLIKPVAHEVNSKGMVLKMSGRRQIANADARNAGVAFVLLGAAFGGGMGLAGGLARRSGRAAVGAALVGMTLGICGAAGTSAALLTALNRHKNVNPDDPLLDLFFPLLVHAGIWATIGGAGGLAFGLGLGERKRRSQLIMAGLIGAIIATVVYELVGGLAFPAAKTTQFISETWQTRLFARLIVTVFAAIGAVLALGEERSRPDASGSRTA